MLDAVHYMFENDNIPLVERHLEMKSAVRESIYRDLYREEYKYKIKARESSQQDALGFDPEMSLPDLPPEQLPTKPYIPPTDLSDLPGILDAPLG